MKLLDSEVDVEGRVMDALPACRRCADASVQLPEDGCGGVCRHGGKVFQDGWYVERNREVHVLDPDVVDQLVNTVVDQGRCWAAFSVGGGGRWLDGGALACPLWWRW